MNVGAAVKQLLADRGLKQADLARGTGLSTSYVARLVTGKQRDVTLEKACLLADYFDMTIDEFAEYVRGF